VTTTTAWKIGLSANWNVGADWTSGVPNGTTDALMDAAGSYTVSLTGPGIANSLTIDSAGATLNENATGALNLATTFTLESGKAILHAANSITDGVTESGGVLETANSAALGSAAFTFSGGEFIGLLSEAVGNPLEMSGNMTFAAADATVLTLNSATSWNFDASNPTSIVFGQGVNDGTVIWSTPGGSTISGVGDYSVEIAKGILQAGDSAFSFLFDNDNMTTIDAGARLDEHGFNNEIANLQGAGTIANTGAAAALQLFDSGDFSGVIQDNLSVEVFSGPGMTLSGNNTYTGGTIIDPGGTLQLGSGGASGTVAGDIVDNGALYYDRSGAIALTNPISGNGMVTYAGGGTYTVNQAEIYSGTTTLSTGELSFNNSGAFGTGDLTIVDGELLATASATLDQTNITLDDNTVVAAAHGQTLTLDDTNVLTFTQETNSILTFGQGGNNGTVVIMSNGETVSNNLAIDVHAGALKAGDSNALSFMLDEVSSTTVDAGATLNWGGFDGIIANLQGAGSVVDKGATNFEIRDGDFSGVISGAESMEVSDGVILTGANTYSGGTTIDTGDSLSLGDGGATGSIAGDIVDNGSLFIDRSNAVSETAAISGPGGLVQFGTGTTTIDRAETFSGGVSVVAGELSISRSAALGTGTLSMQGGELLVTGNAPISNTLDISNDVIFAAASGTTLKLNTGSSNPWTIENNGSPGSIVFGEGANNGTIVWHTPIGSSVDLAGYTVEVRAGTLMAGDSSFDLLTAQAASSTVDSGATIDLASFSADIVDLQGTGSVTNSSTAATLNLINGNFGGTLDGALSVDVFGSLTLSGSGNMTGGFTLEGAASLNLSGSWAQNIDLLGTSTLVLHTPAQYTGKISGFSSGDVIDIHGVNFTSHSFSESFNPTTGVLTIADGTHTQHATFTGAYVLGNFLASSDGGTGTDIAFATAEAPPHPLDVTGPMLASDHPAPLDFG
jgi:fibronectin-binding autotransporter adhesin